MVPVQHDDEPAQLRHELLQMAEDVGSRVRSRGFVARTIGIKIRFADFRTVTRVRTLPAWTDATADIYDTAVELYRGLRLDRPRIRLVGVKCEGLRGSGEVAEQLTLDFTPRQASERRDAQAAIDAARARFGDTAVRAGSLVRSRDP